MPLTTTLKQLKAQYACKLKLETLIASLPEDYGDETPIPLSHILESNGLEHAIWSLRTQDSKYSVQFAIACAERVLPIFENQFPEDDRPRKAIEAAKTATIDPKNPEIVKASEAVWQAGEEEREATMEALHVMRAAQWTAEAAMRASKADTVYPSAVWVPWVAEAARTAQQTSIDEQQELEAQKLDFLKIVQ